ncbi:GGDEF domain-containing protein [Rhodanobacter sp. B2A1Ga4]|uniref:GGDEF domain-containing protein n=1 Tax=Rhodanobacter sp. B2A1Ga4 TaxID=2778647 RepID=UPI001B38C4B7|nr:GGDEF domain-containing protein [Rhodanobacter sp. B2A1Ga4]MBQ4856253.1 GGDEF domain-containing protein [Rhodanobacter sp. B2A1Ga4]
MITVPFHHDLVVVQGFLRFSRAVALLVCAVALVVLAGWWWDRPLLVTIWPGQAAMTANAAIGFVLSGSSLLLSQNPAPWWSGFGRWLSLAVLAIGAVTLLEYLWMMDPGIDHLFAGPPAWWSGRWPGRMTEPVAVGFVLLGGLGALPLVRRWLYLREGLAIGLLVISMSGLASYGIALVGKSGMPFGRMPIHTSLLMLLATLGWLCVTPTLGLTRVATADTLGGALARRLLLPALLLPAVFAFVFELLQSWLGLSETLAFVLLALFSGGAVAGLVWWVANLFDELERQHRKSILLRNDADTDILTGLANRRALDEALASLLRGQREHDAMFSLLMLDLDRFKSFNDDFGHLVGDQVLRITGQLLRAALRPSDMAARYGGEEFVLLLPDTDLHGASEVAARLLDAFRGFAWPQRTVTVSIGVAQAAAGETTEDLIRRADTALYDAKHAGRDQAVAAIALPQAVRAETFPHAITGP